MKYDGVVLKIDKLYLFLLDPDINKIKDGINISDHECYNDIKNDQLMVVEVEIKDGTETIDNVDLDDFIYGDSYGSLDTFIHIHDVNLFTISDDKYKKKKFSFENIIREGKFSEIAIECIKSSKNKENL